MTMDLVPNGNTDKQPFLHFLAKHLFFSSKKYPKSAKSLIFIWEMGTFFFAKLCPAVTRTLNLPESRCSSSIVGREDDCRFSKTATSFEHHQICERHLLRIVFGRDGTKWAVKANIWLKMPILAAFGPKSIFLG